MKNKLLRRLLGFGGILISGVFIWYIFQKFDVESSWDIIKSVPPGYIMLMVLIYLSTFIFRAFRWKLMLLNLPDPGIPFFLKSIILGFAGNNILPARGGEILRMEYFYRRTKISRTTSLTSILLEKVIDAVTLLFFLFLASMFMEKNNSIFSNIILVVSLVFLPILLFLTGLRIYGKVIIRWLESKKGKISRSGTKQFKNIYAALLFIKADLNTGKIVGLSLIIWFLEGLVFVIGLSAIGLNNSIFLIGFMALCIVNFGILIPSSPGYIGVFQAVVILVLTSFSITETTSLACSLLIHFCQYLPITMIGIIILLYGYFKIDKKHIVNP